MRLMLVLVVFFWLLAAATPAHARECSATDAQAAELISAKLTSWRTIYSAHKRYGHCSDGAIAEGFTDSVVRLLAAKWTSLAQAQRFMRKDSGFQDFILHHINASADPDELSRIATLAAQECPASADLLCKQIRQAALEQ